MLVRNKVVLFIVSLSALLCHSPEPQRPSSISQGMNPLIPGAWEIIADIHSFVFTFEVAPRGAGIVKRGRGWW